MSAAAPQLSLVRTPPSGPWLTAEQAMQTLGWSRGTFYRRAGELLSREAGNARNGRTAREYRVPQATPAPEAPRMDPLFASAPAPMGPCAVLPDPEDQARADLRYSAIRPVLEYAADPSRYLALRLKDGRAVTSKRRMIEYQAETTRNSVRTLYQWMRLYAEGNVAALGPKKRSDKGISRWAAQNAQSALLLDVVAYAHLREDLSIQMACEIAASCARAMGSSAPSYDTARRWMRNINRAALTLSKEGRRVYDANFAFYIRRGYTDRGAGEILVSDHALLDVLAQNNIFDDRDRKLIRLRFTGLLDMRSRRVTAYAFSQEGSSRSITTCLFHHCIDFGPFRGLYADNGKDYQRVGRGAKGSPWLLEEMPPEARGVVSRLNAEIKYCLPFHPQSKLIERFNNTLHQRNDRRWATYCGPKPEKRPDRCTRIMERHNKLLAAGRVEESEAPLASEVIRACIAWIEGEYHHHRMEEAEGMDGLTPLDAWEKFRWEGASEPIDPAILVPLLAERESRIIHNGRIKLQGRSYVAADAASSIQLYERSGSTVLVAYDRPDDKWIVALDENGYIVAYLKPDTLLRQSDDEETRAAIAASMQERHGHYRRTRGLLNALDSRIARTGYLPQDQQMKQIGNLPIAIDDVVIHRPAKPGTKIRPNKQGVAPASAADIARSFLEGLK